jgi:3-hydroxyisobutyrate dehydrogenase
MSTRIAVLGLGAMGGAVAVRLNDCGFAVAGFDPGEAAAGRAADAGIEVRASAQHAAVDADVVVTSLPDPPTVRAAWSGPDGVVAAARPGSLLIELSTIDPDTMIDVARLARERGQRVVDCAVSGGPEQAASGELGLLVGADDEDLAAAEPVLSAIGGSVSHAGDVGAGKVVKIVNNLMSMGNVLVAAEAFQVGLAAGVDGRRLYDILARSGGSSQHFVKRFPWVLADDRRTRFSIALGEKDLGLALDLARSVGVPAPTASAVRSIYAIAMAEGLAGDDIVGLTRLYERWTSS